MKAFRGMFVVAMLVLAVVAMPVTAFGKVTRCHCHAPEGVSVDDSVYVGKAILYDAYATVTGSQAECLYPKADLGGRCYKSEVEVLFELYASDLDEHVCTIGDPKDIYAWMEKATKKLEVEVRRDGKKITPFELTVAPSGYPPFYAGGTWVPPKDAAGNALPGKYEFVYKGRIRDRDKYEDGSTTKPIEHKDSLDGSVDLYIFEAELILFKVDVDVDADYDEVISVDNPDDPIEVSSGGLVCVGSRDEIILRKAHPSAWNGAVVLTKNSANVKVFKAAAGGAEITFNGTDNKFSNAALPIPLYVQGETVSGAACDVRLTLASDTSGSSGVCTDEITYTIINIDLDIYNSQGGGLVPETDQDGDDIEDEEDIGAFAVANLNDTNGDTHADNDDSHRPVVANGTLGRNEIDLMKLVLRKPQPDLGGRVRLTIVSGNAMIWTDSIKTTRKSGADLEFPVADFTGNTIEWYVEARKATSLQGIKLKYEWQPSGSSRWLCPDIVAATGVWAEKSRFLASDMTAAQANKILGADGQYAAGGEQGGNPVRNWVNTVGGTGVKGVRNVMVMEFTVSPTDIYSGVPEFYGDGSRARPRFDVSRQGQAGIFSWNAGETVPVQIQIPDHDRHPHFPFRIGQDNELGNDDPSHATSLDENDEPTNEGHLWSFDLPGGSIGVLMAVRANFYEYVRMSTKTDPSDSHYATSGSRCSAKEPWHSKSTNGLATSPREIGAGLFDFEPEALHTEASSGTTVPGTRHHGVMRGLDVAGTAGGAAETTHLILIDDDGVSDDTLDDVTGVGEVGKLAAGGGAPAGTLVGDQTAYTGVGYYASRFGGEIVGPEGHSGETTAELAHEIDVSGSNPQSSSTPVVGTPFSLPSPSAPITMTLGGITTVSIQGARVEAEDNSGGNQSVTLLLIDDDGASDDTLQTLVETVPKLMVDDVAGGPSVAAIKDGLVNPFNCSKGRIASKADGTVIGPEGSSGEQNAEIAYEVEMAGSNPQSASVAATGPVYSMPAPTIGTNPIPIGGASTVTMASVYIEATGNTGNESFEVRVVDDDVANDDVLDKIPVGITRPADCFPGALIGPVTPAVTGMLTNSPPGGEVGGPNGGSGEGTAEIGYEIGGSSSNSATVSVTAVAP